MRIILYLGKGGVGKTTIAAATALRAADLGKRTLVVSTDLAHSLADSLNVTLDARPREITSHLWAQEINALEEIRENWGQLQEYLSDTLRQQGIDEVAAEEMALIPGMDEVASLLNIYRRVNNGDFDVAVIDAAPTGETVRLLSMPDTFSFYVRKLNRFQGAALNMMKPLLRNVVPGVNVLEAVDNLNEQVAALREVLMDPQVSSYRPVVTPEKMVIKEALRAETYLALFGYPIDSVICNRVLPQPTTDDPFMQSLYHQQQPYLREIHDTFEPLPVREVPYNPTEIVGLDALRDLAIRIYADSDPTQVYYVGRIQEVVREGDEYLLRLPLPHIELNKVVMTRKGDELYIEIGNFKRAITLPVILNALEAKRARMVNGALEVRFGQVAGQ
jgi:arsenite/tail-anchored protein-transporting ATPase